MSNSKNKKEPSAESYTVSNDLQDDEETVVDTCRSVHSSAEGSDYSFFDGELTESQRRDLQSIIPHGQLIEKEIEEDKAILPTTGGGDSDEPAQQLLSTRQTRRCKAVAAYAFMVLGLVAVMVVVLRGLGISDDASMDESERSADSSAASKKNSQCHTIVTGGRLGVAITEFLADNENGLLDEDADSSDWIEIHNGGLESVDLCGLSLTDDVSVPAKWVFPAIVLDPDEYIIVFASSKDRSDPTSELHTNFKLGAGGEYLGLFDSDGMLVLSRYAPKYPRQTEDRSYGIDSNGDFKFFSTPTPGKVNGVGDVPAPVIPASARGNATFDLAITEFLANNDAGLQDEDEDSSDWIEIHNGGLDPVNLAGLSLTNDVFDLTKWIFPAVVLSPDEYLVVFASSKDRFDPRSELHTNFKLKARGEYLGLFDADGKTVLSDYRPAYPPQSTDVSYGITSNNDRGFFSTPTPGVANGVGDGAAVTADFDRGFYDAPFSVTLESVSLAEIRYTVDGSEPSSTSGAIYSSPVNVMTTTVLKAAPFMSGARAAATTTVTYIFLADVIEQPATIPGFPNGRLRNTTVIPEGNSVPLDMQMDPDVVAEYDEIIDSLKSIPTMSIVASPESIFGSSGFYFGEDIEVVSSVEILNYTTPSSNEQIDAGVESHSHNSLKRSLRLNFRARHGNRVWTTDLFQNAPLNADTVADSHRTLILRAGNSRSWARSDTNATSYTIDQFSRDSHIAMTGTGSHGTFVHLYLNGVYWGLYNLVERPDEQFLAAYFDGDDDEWFFTNHGGAVSGDSTRWDYLIGELAEKDMSNATNYDEMQQYLNVKHFADYLLLAFYMGWTDWPENNWYFGMRDDVPGLFFPWDSEWSLDRKLEFDDVRAAYVQDTFINDTGSSAPPIAKLWHALRANSDFQDVFSNRTDFHTGPGGALTDDAAVQRWYALNDYIQSAIVGESARWGDSLKSLGGEFGVTRTRDFDWQSQVDKIGNMLQGNQNLLIEELVNAGFYAGSSLTPSIGPSNPPTLAPWSDSTIVPSNPPTPPPWSNSTTFPRRPTTLTLVNAATDVDISPLIDGTLVNLSQASSLNIRADPTMTDVMSVRFAYDNETNFRTESQAPYTIAGDRSNGEDYNAWTPTVGTHTVTATPWSGAGASGTMGEPATATFTVV